MVCDCVCLCMCVYVCVVCVHARICVSVWKLGVDIECLPLSFSTVCIEEESLTWTLSLPVGLVWLVSLLQRSCLLLPSTRITSSLPCPLGQHLHECYRSELWSSCMASTLPINHFLNPIAKYFIKSYLGDGRWMEAGVGHVANQLAGLMTRWMDNKWMN